MKKVGILVIIMIMVIGYASLSTTLNINGNSKLVENISDFKVYLDNVKVNGEEVEVKNNDTIELNDVNGNITYDIVNDSTEYDAEVILECSGNSNTESEWTFDYTGNEQTFIAPTNGTYKLETWGAQGGSASSTYIGGYGGYSVGQITLNKDDILYINVGGKGVYENGGYNGGGNLRTGQYSYGGSGGGATHVASTSGLLETLENEKDSLYIVSGGGGGANYRSQGYGDGNGGAGGGYLGNTGQTVNYTNGYGHGYGTGGTQTSGGTAIWISGTVTLDYNWFLDGIFGSAWKKTSTRAPQSAGGGGFYGGGSGNHGGAGGGSGYIGNSLLTEKSMYCYNCTESNETSTKTISTTCANSTPTENCSKIGNGYAKITQLNAIQGFSTNKKFVEALNSYSDSLNNVDYNSLICKLKVAKISRTNEEFYEGPTSWTFDYTGNEQTFTVPKTGTYKLETWGAQGYSINNYVGGYGGYSTGKIMLKKNDNLFIFVGEGGTGGICDGTLYSSYPNALNSYQGDKVSYVGSGGGSSHITKTNQLIQDITNMASLIIVSGGGGAATWTTRNQWAGSGGSGGGYIGSNGTSLIGLYNPGYGGTQTNGGLSNSSSFVLASYGKSASGAGTGGGGGFYGGGSSWGSGGGGSGYIGNTLLTEKSMYCYNCTESNEESTKTISTTCANATATPNCAKLGNGYARITLIS